MLARLTAQTLTGKDLKRMSKEPVTIMKYNELAKVQDIDQIFKTQCVIILLTIEGGNNPVGHWILLMDKGKTIEHFDSYGLDIDEELHKTHENPYLSRLIRDSRRRVIQSSRQYQRLKEDVDTCGRWCVLRCGLKNLDDQQFRDLIHSAGTVPDDFAVIATMLL